MHVKGHFRDFFEESVEDGLFGRDLNLDDVAGISDDNDRKILTVRGLLGLVWNSTDMMPSTLRQQLQDERGWDDEAFTYAQAAQRIHKELSEG